MSTISILDKLHEKGELEPLVKSGIISTSLVLYRKIYHAYHFQVNEKGVENRQAVTDVADVFGVSESTVYKVLKRLK